MVIGLMNTRITQFTAPAVRHLTWCLFSPALASINTTQTLKIQSSPDLNNWLENLNKNPSHLLQYIQQHNHQLLGSYFECLWQYYFKYGPDVSLIQHHIQVSDHKQTLGELDILAKIKQQHFHVELAVKFYLQLPGSSGLNESDWVGPQSRDRLDIKLKKLITKQFPFLFSVDTIQHLTNQKMLQDYQQTLALKGYLFQQFNQEYKLPLSCNPPIQMGSWIHANQIQELFDSHSENPSYWALLPKHQWLGECLIDSDSAHTSINVLNKEDVENQILQHFYQNTNPKKKFALMLVTLSQEDRQFRELNRYFIVHDTWPEPAS